MYSFYINFTAEDVAGKITLKHLYEIAQIKSEDPSLALMDLQQITSMLVGVARTAGIEIVRDLDPKEYKEFLDQRSEAVAQRIKELQEAKEAKMLRTG